MITFQFYFNIRAIYIFVSQVVKQKSETQNFYSTEDFEAYSILHSTFLKT